ncbi:MAG: ABC-2 transporter permease [Christensenellales bacterium]|jgi:ABC-2 type transport system permease protein
MHNALKLAALDFRTVKPYLAGKYLALMAACLLVVGFTLKEPAIFVSIMMLWGIMYCTYPFSIGEQGNLDTLYATLAVSRRDVVAGRYLYALGIGLLAMALAVISGILFALPRQIPYGPDQALVQVGACMAVLVVLVSIQLPIYFKLGYAKAKMLAYLPMFGFLLFVPFGDMLEKPLAGMMLWISQNTLGFALICSGACLGIFTLSYTISARLYEKRDF